MDIDRAEFVIVDTETTGSRAGDDRLIEIGAARLVGGEIVDTFQQLIDPGRHVPNRITRLTGISTAMVYGQPSASEVMPRFLEFLGDAVIDFLVTCHLFSEHPGSIEPGHLTNLRSALVNNNTLARISVERRLYTHLLYNSPR